MKKILILIGKTLSTLILTAVGLGLMVIIFYVVVEVIEDFIKKSNPLVETFSFAALIVFISLLLLYLIFVVIKNLYKKNEAVPSDNTIKQNKFKYFILHNRYILILTSILLPVTILISGGAEGYDGFIAALIIGGIISSILFGLSIAGLVLKHKQKSSLNK